MELFYVTPRTPADDLAVIILIISCACVNGSTQKNQNHVSLNFKEFFKYEQFLILTLIGFGFNKIEFLQ